MHGQGLTSLGYNTHTQVDTIHPGHRPPKLWNFRLVACCYCYLLMLTQHFYINLIHRETPTTHLDYWLSFYLCTQEGCRWVDTEAYSKTYSTRRALSSSVAHIIRFFFHYFMMRLFISFYFTYKVYAYNAGRE